MEAAKAQNWAVEPQEKKKSKTYFSSRGAVCFLK
jgi:hypothetical protein